MSKRGWVASVIAAIAAIGLLVGWVAFKKRHRPAPAAVSVAAIPKIFEGPEITLTGRLQPQTVAQVDAPVAGILDAWFVDEGQEVYQDQLLGRIRNADLDAAQQSAQAAFDRAEIHVAQLDAQSAGSKLDVSRSAADQVRARNELDRIEKIYQRYKSLMDAGAIARLTFEKTESDYTAAKAEAVKRDAAAKEAEDKAAAIDRDSEEAKKALAEQTAAVAKAKDAIAACDLHSPADGVVVTRNVHQGAQVEAKKDSLITIATDLTKLAVSATPEALVLPRIHPGQHAFVRLSDAELAGEVHEIRGAEVIVYFKSPTAITKLDTAAQVRIVF